MSAEALFFIAMLTLRLTGLSPPVYRDQLDYEVIEDGRSIGRMYEDWHATLLGSLSIPSINPPPAPLLTVGREAFSKAISSRCD
jgi:hypothetical protein